MSSPHNLLAPQATPHLFVLSKEKIPNLQICSLHSKWHWNNSEATVSFLMRKRLSCQRRRQTGWETDSLKPPYKPWAVEIDTAMIGLDCISNTVSLAKKKIPPPQPKQKGKEKKIEYDHVWWEIALGCHFFALSSTWIQKHSHSKCVLKRIPSFLYTSTQCTDYVLNYFPLQLLS